MFDVVIEFRFGEPIFFCNTAINFLTGFAELNVQHLRIADSPNKLFHNGSMILPVQMYSWNSFCFVFLLRISTTLFFMSVADPAFVATSRIERSINTT